MYRMARITPELYGVFAPDYQFSGATAITVQVFSAAAGQQAVTGYPD
jgi:hypothetical protein